MSNKSAKFIAKLQWLKENPELVEKGVSYLYEEMTRLGMYSSNSGRRDCYHSIFKMLDMIKEGAVTDIKSSTAYIDILENKLSAASEKLQAISALVDMQSKSKELWETFSEDGLRSAGEERALRALRHLHALIGGDKEAAEFYKMYYGGRNDC